MSKFLISRTADGVCFSLLADNGRRLAASRTYATLDACKKGIASLIVNAPTVPLFDSSAGEYGANPKFEIVADGEGFGFLLKSANGKSVITSSRYATKKACLRAVAMLRSGVVGAVVLLRQNGTDVPVVMTAHLAAVGVTEGALATPAVAARSVAAPTPFSEATDAVASDADTGVADTDGDGEMLDAPDAPPCEPPVTQGSIRPVFAAPEGAAVPRLVRLQPSPTPGKRSAKKAASPLGKAAPASPKSPRKLLELLFKRK